VPGLLAPGIGGILFSGSSRFRAGDITKRTESESRVPSRFAPWLDSVAEGPVPAVAGDDDENQNPVDNRLI
jgi:hypothetical protein